MNWRPSDLVADADLVAYESTILTQFGRVDWQDKRHKVLEDWLWPVLASRGFPVAQFRTRYTPAKVLGYTSSAYTDKTTDATDSGGDDLNLATILAASTDYLYIASGAPFRGLSVRMLDSVSAVSATPTLQVWGDVWQTLSVTDGTQATSGKPFSRGGSMTWRVPETWVARSVNSVGPYYWARLSLSATPTSALAGQVGVIRRSALCAPATFKTLAMIFAEAPTTRDGPWLEKREYYEQQATDALERAVALIGGEFDSVTVDDQIDATEASQTAAEVSNVSGWTLERG